MRRLWETVSRQCPCPICEKCDWCSVSTDGAWALCRRVDTGAGLRKVDKAGGEFWLYRVGAHASPRRPTYDLPPRPQTERATPVILDRVYRALLAALQLSAAHRQALRQRGLADTEILPRRYRTLPLAGRAALARRLVDQVGAEVCTHVPGFYIVERDGRRWWSLAGTMGLLIPVRDVDGRIVALKVRADEPGDGPKYTTVSSAKHGGPSPGAQVHVPLHAGPRGDTFRITEGELKADVATTLSGILTVSVPGVALWRRALPVLQALHAHRVLLAFDADWRTNPHVAQALGQATLALIKAGFEGQVETWDPALGKGIDDLLAAGHSPVLHAAALAFGASLRGYARARTDQLRAVAAEEIPPWR